MKVCVITGGSSGIGKYTAIELVRRGYTVYALSRHAGDAAGVRYLTADVTCDADIRAAVDTVLRECGRIDLLINNAGISYVGLLQDMSDDEWTAIVNSNLSSVFYNCRAVIPTMLAQQYGKIINITSVWGEIGASTEVAYSATKGGVCAFTKALAKELGPSHITVNAVSCGFIDTRMNGQLSDDERSSLFEEIPVGRPASAEETADFIVQVAQSGEYLTGQVLRFDGGWI